MSASDSQMPPDKETLEHLLGVVVENREKRCQDVRDRAQQQAAEIIQQAYARSRGRLHRHVNELREKSRLRVASARARNQTLLRQQHQKEDRAVLDVAWPLLREAMLDLWSNTETRTRWLDAAVAAATQRLRHDGWRIEHPHDFIKDDASTVLHQCKQGIDSKPKLAAVEDLEAGVRIISSGTVVDATLDGLLSQKTAIEAVMLDRIKQGADGDN